MNNGNSSARNLVILFFVFGAAIAGVETLLNRTSDGTLLVTLTFWTMMVQGCVALAAVGEVTKGLWLVPIKRDLLSFYPLIAFMAFLYLLIGMRMDIYAWTQHPNGWLNTRFFIIRNFVVMLVTFRVAGLLAGASMRGSPKKNTYAVLYITLFITSQSLIAFDWIMSLEYPWISTLFGGHFFVQSFIMGLSMSVIIIFFRTRQGVTGLTESLRDAGKMLFGFCFLWGGFLFAQYLVIWYGNIPEEVDYILKRVDPSPYWGLSRVALALIFAVPFVSLLSRQLKTVPAGMMVVISSVLVGLFIEKFILVTPVVPISLPHVAVEFGLMIVLLALVFRDRNSFMPQQVAHPPGAGEPAGLTSAHNP